MNKNQSHAVKQEFPAGMYIVAGNPGTTSNDDYLTVKQDQMFMSPRSQMFSTSSAFPVGMYPNKDTVDDTVIRRTRSLIPHSVKCQIIQLAQDNPRITQGEIAQMFGIDRTTVSKILKRRHKFLEETASDQTTSSCSPPKIMKTDSMINEALYNHINLWYLDAKKKGEQVTQSKVFDAAKTIAKSYGISNVSVDNDWLCRFFIKYNIDSDIEDLVKKEYASSSDEIPALFVRQHNYLTDSKDFSPKVANFNKGRSGNKSQRASTTQQHVTTSRQSTASATVSSSQPGTSGAVTSSRQGTQQGTSGVVTSSRQGSGNKIPRVQTETADTTRDDLSDIKKEMDELDTNEALRREMGNLEKFREQQKMMEETNKQRKALLSKTLSERQKAAQQEARKLAHIQREVMILDNLLTADVNVIRSRIEVASRDFLDAQKRYERAEKEFVESKVDLQKKSELKEHLTEHLYTIIHQNELRKANKLSELMKELEMEQNTESQILPSLPPLSSFNSISPLRTLHSPKSPPHTAEATQVTTENVKPVEHAQNVKISENVKHVELTENVKQMENVIRIDLTDSLNSDDIENSKQIELTENVQDQCSAGDHSKSLENVILKNNADITEQNVENDEKRIVETSDNDDVKSSLNNESQVSNVDNDKIAPAVSGISTPTDNVSESDNVSELEVQKVSESEVQVQQEEETPNIELPSAWTLDVVKKEQAS